MNTNPQAPENAGAGVPSSRRLHARPFTLAEVLIAIGLFGIMIATSVSLYSYILFTDSFLMTRNAAVNIAQAQMDYLRTVDMATLKYANENEHEVNASGEATDAGGFFRTTTITPDASGTFCKVDILVRVPAYLKRPEQRMSFSSIVMDRALINNLN